MRHTTVKEKIDKVGLTCLSIALVLSTPANGNGVTCMSETGSLLKQEIKEGYSADQVQAILKSHGLRYTYVSVDEVNKVVDRPGARAREAGTEFLIRVPTRKEGAAPPVVRELEIIVIRLDYRSNKVVRVECKPARVGP
jgi:hypothetical protein